MKTKVTLSLEEGFVKEAKRRAKTNNKTLSGYITDSVIELEEQKSERNRRTQALKELAGSIRLPEEVANMSIKEIRDIQVKDKHGL